MLTRSYFILSLLFALPCLAQDMPGIPLFIDDMVARHQFKREELVQVFQRAQYRQPIITAITTPSTAKPWLEYRAAFINDKRITGGLQFWSRYKDALQIAEKEYGVPQEIIVALIGVETLYGRNSGKFSALDALTTLAFSYPPRADFFRSELENYLLLARDQEWELFKIQSSYAGALGIPQFMPSSYRKHAVDFDNDDQIDLLNDSVDAIGSVANYLKQYGWRRDEPIAIRAKISPESCPGSLRDPRPFAAWVADGVTPSAPFIPLTPFDNEYPALLLDFTVVNGSEFWLAFKNFQVITLYNNSNFYAMSVLQLANALQNARKME